MKHVCRYFSFVIAGALALIAAEIHWKRVGEVISGLDDASVWFIAAIVCFVVSIVLAKGHADELARQKIADSTAIQRELMAELKAHTVGENPRAMNFRDKGKESDVELKDKNA